MTMEWGFDPAQVRWATGTRGIDALCRDLRRAETVVWDLETTGLDQRHPEARIVMASFTLPPPGHDPATMPPTWIVGLSHPGGTFRWCWRPIARVIAEAMRGDPRVSNHVGHNFPFDAKWAHAHTGVDLSGKLIRDTGSAAYLENENSSSKLKHVVPREFGVDRWDDYDLSKPGAAERVPFFDLALYAAKDAYGTWALDQLQQDRFLLTEEARREAVPDPDLEEYARLGRFMTHATVPYLRMLARCMQRGMPLDRDWTEAALAREAAAEERYADKLRSRDPALEEIAEEEGFTESWAGTSHWWRHFTARAVERGELEVLAHTAKGRPSWSADVLKQLRHKDYDLADTVLRYRSHEKEAQYLRAWLSAQKEDGRVYPTFKDTSTVTGRLSSEEPNAQNASKSIRPMVAGDHLIVEIDFSQIELRCMAHIARCEPMIEVFREGRDIHREFAAALADVPYDLVTEDQRYGAKAGNFGLAYGMSPWGFRHYAREQYDLYLTEEKCLQIHRAYFRRWDGLEQWHARTISEARRTGRVSSPMGRVRRLTAINSPNDKLRGHQERMAVNAPVQAFASDLNLLAAARIDGAIPRFPGVEGLRVIALVHDSVVAEVVQDWQYPVAQAMRAMTDVDALLEPFGVTMRVPIEVEAEVGHRWGQPFAVVES